MIRFGMRRADARLWRAARTMADLGDLTARWLEGSVGFRPGYQPRCGPDPETEHLVPVLAAANRSGFVTEGSQPGLDVVGVDGSRWTQRAAVTGFTDDQRVVEQLRAAALHHGLTYEVCVADQSRARPSADTTVTWRDGEAVTGFGGPISRRDVRTIWHGCHRAAVDLMVNAWQITLTDRQVGRNSVLWPALTEAAANLTTQGAQL